MKKHIKHFLWLLFVIGIIIFVNLFVGCCPKIIDTHTETKVVDSVELKKQAVLIKFKTDSIRQLYSKQLELINSIEQLDSMLLELELADNDSIREVIINHYIKTKIEPFSGCKYGFGTWCWSMSKGGLFEQIFTPADTNVVDTILVAEKNKITTKTVTDTIVKKEMPWWGWLLIGLLTALSLILAVKR